MNEIKLKIFPIRNMFGIRQEMYVDKDLHVKIKDDIYYHTEAIIFDIIENLEYACEYLDI